MKIPKHIQNKMHKVAKLYQQANSIMSEVDAWFEAQGYDDTFVRSGNGISLEELEAGNDITNEFVMAAENDFNAPEWN